VNGDGLVISVCAIAGGLPHPKGMIMEPLPEVEPLLCYVITADLYTQYFVSKVVMGRNLFTSLNNIL